MNSRNVILPSVLAVLLCGGLGAHGRRLQQNVAFASGSGDSVVLGTSTPGDNQFYQGGPGAIQSGGTPPPPPPPASPAACTTVNATAAATPDLSTLVAALRVSGFDASLADANFTGTIFAPTNAAFAAAISALNTTAPALLANRDLVRLILATHVWPNVAALAANLTNGRQFPTWSNTTLTSEVAGGVVRIRSPGSTARVTTPDIRACRAVVHIIDTVLLPAAVARPPATPVAGRKLLGETMMGSATLQSMF